MRKNGHVTFGSFTDFLPLPWTFLLSAGYQAQVLALLAYPAGGGSSPRGLPHRRDPARLLCRHQHSLEESACLNHPTLTSAGPPSQALCLTPDPCLSFPAP